MNSEEKLAFHRLQPLILIETEDKRARVTKQALRIFNTLKSNPAVSAQYKQGNLRAAVALLLAQEQSVTLTLSYNIELMIK